jgi:Barrel-sandwich domain of CusB or HlyD membrane-fusion
VNALFRSRALEQAQEIAPQGDLLRLTPAWTRWAYWLIVGGAAAAVLYVSLARVDEWAQGPALIRVEGASELTATAAGTVASVAVEPGQQVGAGALLVTLTSDNERAQLERLTREFDLQLARILRDPSDHAARQSLVTLRVERDLARARLAELSLHATNAGTVEDISVRPGQALAPGDQILTISGRDRTCSVWALLPGRYRPELKHGAHVRFNVHGYRYAQASAELSTVGAHVLGPREVGRYLGNEVAGALELQGSTVIAKAELPSCDFSSDKDVFRFHQGMSGTGEVQLRSDALWAVLFPDLRKVGRWLQ